MALGSISISSFTSANRLIACGQLTFRAESLSTPMCKIAYDPHPSILDINKKAPIALELIIAQPLEKNANDHYQRAGEMTVDTSNCFGEL